jgi:crotonobetainyl-CoA:carnitine CoA-transferase CaiB-like acyl-CoA transferase
MGRPELAAAERWGRMAARVADRVAVNAAVAEWTLTLTRDELLAACAAAEVPCGPIYAIDEIFDDPQYAARQNILYADDPRVGVVAVPNTVPRLDETPGRVEWLGPALGAHTAEILTTLAGVEPGELERLRGLGVV